MAKVTNAGTDGRTRAVGERLAGAVKVGRSVLILEVRPLLALGRW